MSCVWDSLIGALGRHQLIRPGVRPRELIQWLKANNSLTSTVRWQDEPEPLSEQLQRENYERIRLHDLNDTDGYLTGSADPFLFLVAELFHVDIEHRMMGYDGRYTTIWYRATPNQCTIRRLRLQSSMGHMSTM